MARPHLGEETRAFSCQSRSVAFNRLHSFPKEGLKTGRVEVRTYRGWVVSCIPLASLRLRDMIQPSIETRWTLFDRCWG